MNGGLPRILSLTSILALMLAGVQTQSVLAAGTISLTALDLPYTQNFDTLGSTGTSGTVPTGWDFLETGTNANTTYTAGTGSANAGDTYSFGAAASTERAFGGLLSGTLTPLIGAQFTNNTGATITSLTVAYTGEQWRAGVTNRGAADRLDFQLSTDASSLGTGTWTDYDGLDFSSPAINETAGALDGNAGANRTAVSFTITGLGIPSGASFWIRWVDVNIPEADDGLAVDDFSLTPDSAQCNDSYTPIYQIQGSGPAAAITGAVTTKGVVVGDFEYPGSGSTSAYQRGFYIQDPTGDSDPATSDGIFVFNDNNDSVSLGQVVRVTGTAGEFFDQTQIDTVTSIVVCGAGSVAPVDVTFPLPSATDLERFEGMLVRLPQTMQVTEHFQLGRFGQVVLSYGDRLRQPTGIVAPGALALALQAQNDLNRIILDDDSQAQNPDPIVFGRGGAPLSAANTLRGGDIATGTVGVLDYTAAGSPTGGSGYRVRPINALGGYVNFVPANSRPAALPALGGTLKVAGMNLLNFFNTFDGLPDTVDNCTLGVGGAATDCRGADTQAEFDRQWPKTVAGILAIDPAVLAFSEIENDGYGPTSAIATLVNLLNAATAPGTYAFVDADTNTGQVNALGDDAIKVGLIYQPAVVTPVGQTAVLNTAAFVYGGDSVERNRPSLAQAFQANATGGRFVVDVNHLKSRGAACDVPDAGDGQGNCNAVRVNAANALTTWLATDPTGTGVADVLLLGDYNSYAMEDPITAIEGAGFTNLIGSLIGPHAYSYVFDGQWGYLDHVLGSPAIVPRVTGVGFYHINADEPSVLDYNTNFKTANLQTTLYAADQFRLSDHDPVVVGLDLNDPPLAAAGGPYTANEGQSVPVSGIGSDPDGTAVTFDWDLDNDGTFETPGQSVLFYAVDGPSEHIISVRVTDATGLAAVATTSVHVQNVPPAVNAPSAAPDLPQGTGNLVVSATFSDPGVNDAPFTCTVNYGDGSGNLPGTVAGNACTGPAHAYATPGPHGVTVTTTDKDQGTGTNSAVVITRGVTYDGNGSTGGSVPADANTYVPAATVTVLANTGGLTRAGYTFAGWNTAADGGGTDYAASGSATFAMGAADVTLYAKWVLITYGVTYHGNGSTGGTVPVDPGAYPPGATVTVLGNPDGLTKGGYHFAGWNTAVDGIGASYASGATFSMGTANVSLYAQWVAVPIPTLNRWVAALLMLALLGFGTHRVRGSCHETGVSEKSASQQPPTA